MQHIILLHTNKNNIFHITRVLPLRSWLPQSTIPTCGVACSSVPLWPFLMSIHGVAFTMADGTMHFILYLSEVT
jgi:hypothetical protein